MVDLQLAEAAGWRALMTLAQQNAQIFLSDAIEQYAVSLLYRSLGTAGSGNGRQVTRFTRHLLAARDEPVDNLPAVGDHCLLFAGLLTEQAMRQGIPVTYFVQVGQQAYHDHAARTSGADGLLYRELAQHFVALLDVFLTMRELNDSGPSLDGLNAYQLWCETGSHHGWQVLRQLTPALPAVATHARH